MNHDPNHPFMRETTERRSNSAGELPAEFDRHLVELDRKLSRQVSSEPVPPGLAERIFRASAALLPPREEHAPLRLPRRRPAPVWGQLAMAASVAVAFVVAAWFHSSTIMPSAPDQGGIVHHSPSAILDEVIAEYDDAREARAASRAEMLSPEALRVLFDDDSHFLLDTRDMTHADAVEDLHQLYAALSEL